jgi:uracil-DNA glycosylase
VVVGQDPYQKVAQATGRSFEQGDLLNWLGNPAVSPSLKRIIQSLATFRSGNSAYSDGSAGWNKLVNDIGSSTIQMPAPLALWDSWQGKGVLFINAILTFNRADPAIQFDGHGLVWAPIVKAIFGHLVRRQNKSLVFVAWGDKAKRALEASGAIEAARDAGTWGKSVVLVERPHPNARPTNDPPFLRGANAFRQINDALLTVGAQKMEW